MKILLSIAVFCLLPIPKGLTQAVVQPTIASRLDANRDSFPDHDQGRSLKEEIRLRGGDVVVQSAVQETPAICSHCQKGNLDNDGRIEATSRQSDLVVVGTVLSNSSQLTRNEAYVFTDSEFRIDEIWKGAVAPGVFDDGGIAGEITVTAPGGTMQVDGHTVTVIPAGRKQLLVGHTYLLFLEYVPRSHSYVPNTSLIGYDITGNQVSCLKTSLPPPSPELMGDRSAYLASVRSSVERQPSERKPE